MLNDAHTLSDIAQCLDGEGFLDRLEAGLGNDPLSGNDFAQQVLAVAAEVSCPASYPLTPHLTVAQAIRTAADSTDDTARVLLLAVFQTPGLTGEGFLWLLSGIATPSV